MAKLLPMSRLALFVATATTLLSADLSKYRGFQFGADLPSVAKQTGQNPSEAKVIHLRPVLIQELDWRPQPTGNSQMNAVQDVLFSFYDGHLFQITVEYDQYEIEGLTTTDLVEAISQNYGSVTRKAAADSATTPGYIDREDILAEWQDPQYRFELLRFSYGRHYKLVGVSKALEQPAKAAMIEGERLENQDAPQREAARIAAADETERARLDKARQANKAKFKP